MLADVPEEYGTTEMYRTLRTMERFPWLTPERIELMPPGELMILAEYNRIRSIEESRNGN